MSPLAQVGHVLWKDLREHRVRVAVFVVVVGIALARALGVAIPVESMLLSIITFLTGLAIVGAPVDGDAPTDPRNAWATRPLAPGAVVSAKLAFALLLVLAAAIAQAIAVRSLVAVAGTWAAYVVRPTLVFGYVVLAVLVLCAASTDVKHRLLLVLALALAIGIPLARYAGVHDSPLGRIAPVVVVVGPLLMLATLAWFYRRRPTGVAPIAVAFLVVFVAGFGDADGAAPPRIPEWHGDIPRPALRLKPVAGEPVVQDGTVRVSLLANAPVRGWNYALRDLRFAVTLASGRVIAADADRNVVHLGGDLVPLPLPAVEQDRGADTLPVRWQVLGARLPADPAVEGEAVTRVTLTASLLSASTRPVDTIPLVAGRSHARNGVRSRVDSVITTGGRPRVVLYTEGFFTPQPGPGLFAFTSYYGRTYALVGADGRVLPLHQTWTQGSSGGLVLPTAAFGAMALRLEPVKRAVDSTGASPAHDPQWLAGARLVAYEPQIAGAAPVSVTWVAGDAGVQTPGSRAPSDPVTRLPEPRP